MGLQNCGLNLDAAQRELSPHGTLAFPCAGYREALTDRPEDEIPWHWHDELEIIFVAAGALRVQVPRQEFLLLAGDCLAINARLPHCAATQPSCELHSLVFSPLLLTGSEDSVFAQKYLLPLTDCRAFRAVQLDRTAQRREIDGFVSAFEALAQEAPMFEFTVREKLSALCLDLCRQFAGALGHSAAPARPDDLRIRKMLAYLQENYRSGVTLAQIAAAADVGERECLRCFARTVQISPMQYLLKYRILRSAEALRGDPSASVAEIAAGCGFDSPSNFSRLFRRYYGCTPRAYRALPAPRRPAAALSRCGRADIPESV